MQYPVFIHKEEKENEFGVEVPDLPGCFSSGETMEQALKNAKEAIECHLEGLLIDNDPIPIIKSLEEHLDNPELKGCVLAMVDVDLAKISGKSKRIDITLPARFIKQIDEYIKYYGSNRSAFIAEASMYFMTKHKVDKDARQTNNKANTDR